MPGNNLPSKNQTHSLKLGTVLQLRRQYRKRGGCCLWMKSRTSAPVVPSHARWRKVDQVVEALTQSHRLHTLPRKCSEPCLDMLGEDSPEVGWPKTSNQTARVAPLKCAGQVGKSNSESAGKGPKVHSHMPQAPSQLKALGSPTSSLEALDVEKCQQHPPSKFTGNIASRKGSHRPRGPGRFALKLQILGSFDGCWFLKIRAPTSRS